MLDTVVVDDEPHALGRMKEFVIQANGLKLVGDYSNPDNCLTEIRENKISPELVFLDIEMPDCNGLELAERILEIDEGIDIVFITAYDSYAVEAFELNALDYLLKPITEERFQKTISRLSVSQKTVNNKDFRLNVFSLGHFRLFTQGEEISLNWPTAKSKELFLYLLYHRGNFVSSDKIVEALWSNKDPEKAVAILYTTVYSLRKLIKSLGFKEIVFSKRGYYKLNMEHIKWDVLEFEKLVNKIKTDIEANIEQVKKLTELYQGQYLPEQAYSWLYALRAELEEKFKDVLLKVADYYLEIEEYQLAIKLLERVIKETFLVEAAYQKLIKTYKELGEDTKARRQYQRLKSRLQKEFGIEPQMDF
ncbi:response regulator [Fuchsiella alkaliacetigena]|uniref:response regulator n=1 Tax=Fuchsiella alkaliacetigena TaxID=957042 RepID=UPI00200A4FE0|nr:response regulator [Fuchsiella alkaliacetigena]MCK8824046.1 response regulator [Fuchsiella alkaliacetigena]